jgi:hypothetical protein
METRVGPGATPVPVSMRGWFPALSYTWNPIPEDVPTPVGVKLITSWQEFPGSIPLLEVGVAPSRTGQELETGKNGGTIGGNMASM